MSHRAIQRLRREREPKFLPTDVDADENGDSDDEREYTAPRTTTSAFSMIDSDSSSDEVDGSDDDDGDDDDKGAVYDIKDREDRPGSNLEHCQSGASVARISDDTIGRDAEEDLDALLEAYRVDDGEKKVAPASNFGETQSSWYSIVTEGIETRDLDIDYVMRTSLLGIADSTGAPRTSARRGYRHAAIFGPPRDNWPRPPHYVGGGMGMRTYDDENRKVTPKPASDVHKVPPLPWPYSAMKEGDERCPNPDKWFKYTNSDNYERDCQDYETIKASGDVNALAMFIAHHPFVVEALLQLSLVLYQTNQSQEGLSLLKRALWVFECASLNSFLNVDGRVGLMDFELTENIHFFRALFRLVRVSYVAGLARASLAVSRFLLSLDPLRDPMNVLLAIDHFALLCNTETCNEWLINFVDSQKVYVTYRDDENPEGFECSLLDLPNWGFSYALALFRVHEAKPTEENKKKADDAIRIALCKFPTVVGQILGENEINVTSRSLQTDWPSVIDFAERLIMASHQRLSDAARSDPVIRACTSQAYETMVRIFVKQSFKLWSSGAVLSWVFENLQQLKTSIDGHEESLAIPLSPAIMRFARCDPADYDNKFQTMPADANPLDPNIVAHALIVDVSRPRFLQRTPRAGADMRRFGEPEIGFGAGNGLMIAGPPTHNIDPDLPLLEVFWRSALPWNHVDGVPPPAR